VNDLHLSHHLYPKSHQKPKNPKIKNHVWCQSDIYVGGGTAKFNLSQKAKFLDITDTLAHPKYNNMMIINGKKTFFVFHKIKLCLRYIHFVQSTLFCDILHWPSTFADFFLAHLFSECFRSTKNDLFESYSNGKIRKTFFGT
jgi:hypothetical protein